MTQNIYPSPIALLKESWELFKTNFSKLIRVMLVPIIVILVSALTLGISSALFAFIFKNNSSALIFLIPIGIIFLVGIMLFCFWSNVAVLYAVTHMDDSLKVKETYRLTWPLIGGFFMTSMIVGFIVIGGFSAFIIPGIVICITTSLTPYIAIKEKIYNLDAALKSRHYLIGHRWAYLGRMLTIFIIQAIVLGVFGALDQKDNSIIITLLEFVFNIASSVFYLIYGYLNYKYLSQMAPAKFDPKVARVKYTIFGFLSILSFVGIILISIAVPKFVGEAIKESNFKLPTQQSEDPQAELDKLMKTLNITPIETPTE